MVALVLGFAFSKAFALPMALSRALALGMIIHPQGMALFGEEIHELFLVLFHWIIFHPALPFLASVGGDLPLEALGVLIFISTPCGRALSPDNSSRLQIQVEFLW